VSARATASQQEVADAFRDLGALKQGLKVSGFWSDRLNTPLRKALAP
jgi:sulfonate transport system substrate-binding protein